MTPATLATAASRAFASVPGIIGLPVVSCASWGILGANWTTAWMSLLALTLSQLVLAAQFAAAETDRKHRNRVDRELLDKLPGARPELVEDV